MQAADLRHSVGFFLRAIVSDGYGNSQGEFAGDPEFIVAAGIKPRLGGEAVLAGRLEGKNFVNVTVRQSADTSQVTPDWRAKNMRTDEILNIRSVIDPYLDTPQHGRFWEMLCEKGVAT